MLRLEDRGIFVLDIQSCLVNNCVAFNKLLQLMLHNATFNNFSNFQSEFFILKFIELLHKLIVSSDLHAPVKTRKVRSTYAPWLTTEIRCEMNKPDHLKKVVLKPPLHV